MVHKIGNEEVQDRISDEVKEHKPDDEFPAVVVEQALPARLFPDPLHGGDQALLFFAHATSLRGVHAAFVADTSWHIKGGARQYDLRSA